MLSKSLVKLIDAAIFPAVLVVFAKVIAIVFLSKYFGFQFQVEGVRLVFSSTEDFLAINSYSSLFMYIAIVAGLSWVTLKAHIFHDTHISPSFSAKIISMNLEELINDTKVIYSQSFIWLSYAWLATVIFGVQSYFDLSYAWLFYVSLAISVIITAILAVDVERELDTDKRVVGEGSDPAENVVKVESLSEEIII